MGTAPAVVGKEHPSWQAQEGRELGPGVGHPSQTESQAHLSLCLLCFMCTATRWGHNWMVHAKDLSSGDRTQVQDAAEGICQICRTELEPTLELGLEIKQSQL